MSFPKILDNASVLYYAPENYYGEVCYTTGEPAEHIRYLAICKYENDTVYCLFGCNAELEVVSDSPWESIEKCKRVAEASYGCVISWIAIK